MAALVFPISSDSAAAQDDELLALESIIPTEQIRIQRRTNRAPAQVSFEIPVVLPTSSTIRIESTAEQQHEAGPSTPKRVDLQLQHLPPLSLTASLPAKYPLEEAPRIERLNAVWFSVSDPQPSQHWFRTRLQELWEEYRGEVLWVWAEWLREGWTEEAFTQGSACPLTASSDTIRVQDSNTGQSAKGVSRSLEDVLKAYDRLARDAAFGKERFLCGICLEGKRGGACTRIEACGHVFCRECLMEYLSLHLTEGSLHLALSCPDPSCTSSRSQRAPGVVASVTPASTDLASSTTTTPVGSLGANEVATFLSSTPHLISRLEFLQAKELAEADPTAVPCPRPDCQTLSPAREEDKGSSRWEAFRQCPRCSMSFCVWCGKTWHAPSPCSQNTGTQLLDRYDAASPEEKRRIELRYGRKNILKLRATVAEEKANREWLKGRTQPCPHCSAPIERSSGCNHMSCTRCGTHFCNLCGVRLNPSQPYLHFNTKGTPCYNRLFEGLVVREPQEGQERDEAEEEQRREEEEHRLLLEAIRAAWDGEE